MIIFILMKDRQKQKNSRWYRLGFDNQNIPQKSNYSKDSLIHSKYTPTKKSIKSPQTKLDIPALKSKIVTAQQLRKHEKSRQYKNDGYKSVIMNQTNRGLNIKDEISNKKLNISVMGSKGKQTSNYNIQVDQILKNSQSDKFQENNLQQLKSNKKSRRTVSNGNFIESFPVNQYQKNKNKTIEKSVEQVFEDLLMTLSSIEKDLENQRIAINKTLDDKQRYLIQIKQKIIKQFVKKQKQIKNQSLRSHLSRYIPYEEQRYTLARVTSQKIFTRAQKLKERQAKIENQSYNKNKQSQYGRSSQSKTKSEYKSNFDIIFGKIKEMKQQFQCIQYNQNNQKVKIKQKQKFESHSNIAKNEKVNGNYLKQGGLNQKSENQRSSYKLGRPPLYSKQFIFDSIKLTEEIIDHYNI